MTAAIALDLVLVLLLLAQAVRGWRAGALAGGLNLAGLVVGAALALWVAPSLIARAPILSTSLRRSAALVAAVLVGALIGQLLVAPVVRRLRAARVPRPLRAADSLLGAVGAVAVGALVFWFAAAALRPVVPTSWAATVNQSQVLTTTDRYAPDQLSRQASRIGDELHRAGWPRVFAGLQREPITAVPGPEPGGGQTRPVARAAASVVKVETLATACGQAQEGSGWVSAPHRVVTNAHVVAGSGTVTVQPRGTGPRLKATVVSFDPDLDLAVLRVPDLTATPLHRSGSLSGGATVVAAGFPEDGPYRATSGRIRSVVRATGNDIYGQGEVTRQVYSVYVQVRPGNSGGPLLTPEGRVAGTVFAKSLSDTHTGYALTNSQTKAAIDRAADDTTPAATGGCISQ